MVVSWTEGTADHEREVRSVALLATWCLLVEIVLCVSEVETNAVPRNINQISFCWPEDSKWREEDRGNTVN